MNPAPQTVPQNNSPVNLPPEVLKRFWSKVDKDGPIPPRKPELGPCWVWTGARNDDGYGNFWLGSKMVSSHRVSYEIENGKIEDGIKCLHQRQPALC